METQNNHVVDLEFKLNLLSDITKNVDRLYDGLIALNCPTHFHAMV